MGVMRFMNGGHPGHLAFANMAFIHSEWGQDRTVTEGRKLMVVPGSSSGIRHRNGLVGRMERPELL